MVRRGQVPNSERMIHPRYYPYILFGVMIVLVLAITAFTFLSSPPPDEGGDGDGQTVNYTAPGDVEEQDVTDLFNSDSLKVRGPPPFPS